jgi:dUTP pyrophosphatase
MTTLQFWRLHKDAILPTRANYDDAGLDIYSIEDQLFSAGEKILIRTGLSLEISEGYFGQIASRSGLAFKHDLVVHQGTGTIDSSYEGELKVMLRNTSNLIKTISKGDRIAQLIIIPCAYPHIVEHLTSRELKSQRGVGGFGSTGK